MKENRLLEQSLLQRELGFIYTFITKAPYIRGADSCCRNINIHNQQLYLNIHLTMCSVTDFRTVVPKLYYPTMEIFPTQK